MSVYPWTNGTEKTAETIRDAGCEKMSLCGRAEQTKEILFHAFDNRQRDDAVVTAFVRLGEEERHLSVSKVGSSLYEFGFAHDEMGVAIVEVFFDGLQIPESPIRVEISPRDCNADFPNQRKIPVSITIDLNQKMVLSALLLMTYFASLEHVRILRVLSGFN